MLDDLSMSFPCVCLQTLLAQPSIGHVDIDPGRARSDPLVFISYNRAKDVLALNVVFGTDMRLEAERLAKSRWGVPT